VLEAPALDSPIELAIERHLAFQHRQWMAERIGWTVMALLLMAAMAGAFGHGPLSKAEETSPDGSLRLEYERMARFRAPAELRVRLRPLPSAGDVSLSIPVSYLDGVSIEEVRPEPAAVHLQGETMVYRFSVAPGTQNMEVLFRFKMETAGRLAGSVAVEGASLPFSQFVFP
jgi:hypothetical protein